VKVQLSPAEALDRILHEEALNPVRELLASLPERALSVRQGVLLSGQPKPIPAANSKRKGKNGVKGRGRGGRR
jgi:hypothetical protein